jgi:hypothetical protein
MIKSLSRNVDASGRPGEVLMRQNRLTLLACGAVSAALTPLAWCQQFGWSLAVDGNELVTGAPQASDPTGRWTGGAYFFDAASGAWHQASYWIAPFTGGPYVADDGDRFGTSVAIRGSIAAVGGPLNRAGPGTGRVQVLERSTSWSPTASVVPADCARDDAFGQSVALGDGFLLAGADGTDDIIASNVSDARTCNSGAVYVFDRINPQSWTQTAKLRASDATCGAHFGRSLALADTLAVIGAPQESGDDIHISGAAYVFEKVSGTWIQRAKLRAPTPTARAQFGYSVAVCVDTSQRLPSYFVLVGAAGALGQERGASYLFRYSGQTATFLTVLSAPGTQIADMWGAAVAVIPGVALVGAPLSDLGGPADGGMGMTWTQALSGWDNVLFLKPNPVQDIGHVGCSAAIWGKSPILGGPYRLFLGDRTGTVSVFDSDGSVVQEFGPLP